jgi:biotin carboxyl carrier protein
MLQLTVNGKNSFSVSNENNEWQLDDSPVQVDIQPQPNGLISIIYNNRSFTGIIEKIDRETKEVTVRINNQLYTVAVKEPMDQLLASMGLDMKAKQKAEAIKAPMPGMILKILVQPGQQIAKGDGLLVLEAMKMENVLKAGHDAVVKSVRVTERTAVEKGAVLIELE